LAISAAYEWIEWWVSLATGDGGDAFLGTQGDVWDTQSDMLFATIGAIAGLILFSKIQDKQIRKL
jgi:putative membrane protein